MNWDEVDWAALDRLRSGFLSGAAPDEPYWRSESDLASYDFTYGERVGWKWDHVLRELHLRGWTPNGKLRRTTGGEAQLAASSEQCRTVLDWGCGSGIAGRRVLSFYGTENFDALYLWDHSPLAADFAARSAQGAFPGLDVTQVTPSFMESDEPIGLLLVSHVLNELSPDAWVYLRAAIARAAAVIWVEPGTRDVSRRLGEERNRLTGDFHVVAPCTHQGPCPMFSLENERHWCHFFAPPAPGIFAQSEWVKFGQRAGIDLRSLPYCFLALERKPARAGAQEETGLSRVIGRPEILKPAVRLLNCDATGLNELTSTRRSNPDLYKELDRTREPLVYLWQREGNQITAGERIKANTD